MFVSVFLLLSCLDICLRVRKRFVYDFHKVKRIYFEISSYALRRAIARTLVSCDANSKRLSETNSKGLSLELIRRALAGSTEPHTAEVLRQGNVFTNLINQLNMEILLHP